MAPTTSNDTHEKHKNFDQEVRDLISALTGRLRSSHKSGGGSTAGGPHHHAGGSHSHADHDGDGEDQGVRIITLAGSNLGATMRGEAEEKADAVPEQQEDFAATYVNSNFQAINNSIMLGGSYKTNDPGVHLDISDYLEESDGVKGKKVKKGKKGKRGGSNGGRRIERSGDESSSSSSSSSSDGGERKLKNSPP